MNVSTHPTSASLLERITRTDDPGAWKRFYDLYTPLLYSWAKKLGTTPADAADLVQDVFAILVKRLPEFRYDPQQKFRAWLWTVTRNTYWKQRQRTGPEVELNEEPAGVDPVPDWIEDEYYRHLVALAAKIIRAEFSPADYTAFWEYVVEDRPAAEVAAELGVSVEVVYQAKSRVLKRLRQELDGLLD